MFNRVLGVLNKVQIAKTGVQAKAALVAAPVDTNAVLQVVGITWSVTVAEAGKFLYLWEESGTVPLVQISLAAVTAGALIFSEEGIPLLSDKDLQYQSDASTGAVAFTVLYRLNPGGAA